GEAFAGGKMKAIGTTLWLSPNTGATNESGFTGLPAGYWWSSFTNIGYEGWWWSSSESFSTAAHVRYLYFNNELASNVIIGTNRFISVRCIKD
ncbi:MAG: FISUMP domain-containing protein, partial [Bacteroidota bacterium]